jgi:hypothetical protein
MADREVIHIPNPRATRINYGGYHSGIMLELTRTGVEVWGYYDGCVGIEGGFITWEDFDLLRAAARLPLKDARAALEAPGAKGRGTE